MNASSRALNPIRRSGVRTAYSGERDRGFRSNVTAAHERGLRGQIGERAVTMSRFFPPLFAVFTLVTGQQLRERSTRPILACPARASLLHGRPRAEEGLRPIPASLPRNGAR